MMADNNVTPQRPIPVNHPNFIPDSTQSGKPTKTLPHGQDGADVKSKPPSGSNGGHNEATAKTKIWRSVSNDGSNKGETTDAKNRNSVGSFGSCDSKTYDEEVVISYRDEAVNIEEQGAGKARYHFSRS